MARSDPRPLAAARCGGRVGLLGISGVRVSVYADRMTVRFFGMGEQTINGSDIVMVSEGGQWGRPLFIKHTAGWWSPLALYWLPDEVKAAILRVKRNQPRGEGPPEEFWYS